MRFPRKLLIGSAAFALAAGLTTMAGIGPAAAAGTYTATGSVTCTGATGSLVFSPALKAGGTTAGHTTLAIKLNGCTTTDGSVTGLTTVTLKGTIPTTTNDCQSLGAAGGTGFSNLAVTYGTAVGGPNHLKLTASHLSVGGEDAAFTGGTGLGTDKVGFGTPSVSVQDSVHNVAQMTGSFAGTTTVTGTLTAPAHQGDIYSKTTDAQVTTACTSLTGLTKLAINKVGTDNIDNNGATPPGPVVGDGTGGSNSITLPG